MNRYFRLFVALLFVAASLATGIAAAQPSESEVSREDIDASDPFVAFGELGFGEDEQRFFHAISQEVVNPQEYLFGDQPNDNPPTLDLPGTHLTCIGAAVVTFPDIDLPTSAAVNGAVYVPSGAGPQPGTDVALMWAKYDRPYDVTGMSFFLNRGFVLPGNSDLGIPAWESTFPGDTWNGGFRMPTLTYGPEPWALTVFEYSPPQTFTPMPMDGFAYLHGDTLIIGVDAGQLFGNLPPGATPPPDGELRFGYHGHDHDGGFGAADGSQSFITTTPEVPGRGYDDFYSAFPTVLQPGSFPITEPAPVETTTTETPATTSAPTTTGASAAPTTVGATAPATTQAPSTSGEGGGGFLGTFLLIIGVLLIIAGLIWWLLFGRPRTGERERIDVGGTRVRDPNRGGGTTPPTMLPPTEHEHSTCDWSLYFNDGGNRIALRKANFQAHECCVYEIEVATRIDEHVQAARARQDDHGERLRIPDFDFSWAWVDLKAHTSTRSGPHGRLDWMHGLGDPTEQASLAGDDGFWQQGQGEEPPEVAVHLVHRETTRIQVKLIPGCPEYDNSYGTYGRSQLDVMATHECTNDAPGAACPVELNAFGLFTGEIWGGGLWTLVSDAPGTDIDELERHAEAKRAGDESAPSGLEGRGPRPLWDGHDHEMRDRATYQANDVASDAGTIDDDSVKIFIETLVDANSGQIVPIAVYPSTERVTTHIETQFDHVVTVDGEMVPKNCESNGCHGHGQCGCAPKFKLQVAGPGGPAGGAGPGGAWIDVDGGAVTILRIPTTANRRTPPAPGGYIPWELKK